MAPLLQHALSGADLDAEMRWARARLRFSAPLEAAYAEDTVAWRRKHYRRSALLGLISYNLFLIVDAVVIPDVFLFSVLLHLGVVTPLMFLAATILTRPLSPRATQWIGTLMPLVYLVQVEVLFLSSTSLSADHYQYVALFPVMFGNSILKLGFRHAILVALVSTVLHAVLVLKFSSFSAPAAVMGIMGLCATCYVTLLALAIQEGEYRRTWLRRRIAELRTVELSHDNAKLSRLSRIDPLTGVANRRGFDLAVESFFATAPRRDEPFCVIMLDVDHFKSYNDTYGHAEGDRCLRTLANVMMDCLNTERDVLGRFGGEEFIAFVPLCHLDAGTELAERIRRALLAVAIPHVRAEGGSIVTASLGVAEGRMTGVAAFHDVIAHADIALYEAKKAGRNRVEPQPVRRRQIRLVEDAPAAPGRSIGSA